MKLGAGRETKDDLIDLFVGVDLHKKIGDHVKKDEPLFTLYHNQKGLEEAVKIINESITISNKKRRIKLIEETIF